ncbi:MAG TPA: hypothetical protein VGZ28_05470 [Terriglobales bacterium]|jgi:hypothetical protein|nr:hypothetical protein [Terriglobales bacterium]
MVKKLLTLVFTSVLALPLSTMVLAPMAPAQEKQSRVEGIVARTSKDKSSITVRTRGGNVEKIVMYDSSTKWTSQEHGSKKVNPIDSSQVGDNDRVICLGSWDKDGVLHATLISKRLTN